MGTVVAVESASTSNSALENDMTISEDNLLSEYSTMVFRPDPYNLCFVLGSGDTLRLCDSVSIGDETVWASHKQRGYLPDANYFTVDVFGF